MRKRASTIHTRWLLLAFGSAPAATAFLTWLQYAGARRGWFVLYKADGWNAMPMWLYLSIFTMLVSPSGFAASLLIRRTLARTDRARSSVALSMWAAIGFVAAVVIVGAASMLASLFVSCGMGDCL